MAGKKMGRPPAPWVYEMDSLSIEENQYMDVYELSTSLHVPVSCLKAFFRKAEVKRKHEIQGGKARARFKIKDLKKAAREYIAPWL